MTWIIGSAALFGSAILVSDARVQFKCTDGTTRYSDCLQKIYPLGRFVIGGFSGSVNIGFGILAALQAEFSQGPPDAALDMNVVANTWLQRVVRRQFREAPDHERQLKSSVILASAHPNQNRGDSPWPVTYVHVLSSPEFVPYEAEVSSVVAIGSGASASGYMDALKTLGSDERFLHAAMNNDGRNASLLAHMVSTALETLPIQGVSSFFQAGVVVRGGHAIWDHEFTVHQPDGHTERRAFPRIARDSHEFDALTGRLFGRLQSAEC
jgi:hypothetical protein